MLKFTCKDTFCDLPEEAAQHVIHQSDHCSFSCEAKDKRELMKRIVAHATDVHGLEDRRLAPAVMMERVEAHITEN
jgi:predicted small metal-binding protein